MFTWFKSGNASRKYSDLIFAAEAKWATWDPTITINVGDYGTIDKKTGYFEKEGNIYSHPNIVEMAAKHPPVEATKENYMMIQSEDVKGLDFSIGPQANVPGLAEASIKGRWDFGSERGALLVIVNPRISYIHSKVLLADLSTMDLFSGGHKSLVTEVVSCPAYCSYLSNKSNGVVDLALLGTVPIPVAPGVSAGGKGEISWWRQNATGRFKEAIEPNGLYKYTPLYNVKKIPAQRRDDPNLDAHPVSEGDDRWVDAKPEWGPLDEDGEADIY